MGKVVVDTGYLRDYARQLASIEDKPGTQLLRYINSHYRNTSGMTSWLAPARKAVEDMADTAEGVVNQTTTGLSGTSCALDSAASLYERNDIEAARRLFSAASAALPDSYVERDQPGDGGPSFPSGPKVELPTPKDVKKAPKYRQQFRKELGGVNEWVKSITGYDVLAETLRVVLPEWGSLDRVADAYAHGEAWYSAVAKDVREGMDTMSPHWTDGEASTAFDYHIREEWLPYLESAALHERLGGELYVMVAELIDAVVAAFAGVVEVFAHVVKKIVDSFRELSASHFWDSAKEFAKVVVAFLKCLRVTVKVLGDTTALLEATIDTGVDGAHIWSDIASGKNKVPALGA
jgi:hypothetical protein